MNEQHQQKTEPAKKILLYQDGRFYFTKEAERTFYFILTLSMLAGGVVYKLWI
jgi:hypothetical protein